MAIHRVVLTGGPCGGKTTSLSLIYERLTSLGCRVLLVPEAATILLSNGARPDFTNQQDMMTFQTQLMRLQLQLETSFRTIAETFSDEKVVMLCDRGVMDCKAFVSPPIWQAVLDEQEWTEVGLRDKHYDAVIHLVTAAIGAEKFYTTENNPARTETAQQAADIDMRLREVWIGHPHLRVIDNTHPSFEDKVKAAVHAVCHAVGVPAPLEIERKFVVRGRWEMPVPHCTVYIEQHYLNMPDGTTARIRRRGQDGSFVYTFTVKGESKNGVRVEHERMISGREYVDLLKYQDTSLKPIRKHRSCFLHEGHYFELDEFLSPHPGLCLLEVELHDRDEPVQLPPFAEIEEVTGNPAYQNKYLASAKPL